MTLEQIRDEWTKARENWLFYLTSRFIYREEEEKARKEYYKINKIRLNIDKEYNERYFRVSRRYYETNNE